MPGLDRRSHEEIFVEWGGVVAMLLKVRCRGNIVLDDRRSGLSLDCNSVN